VELSGIPAHNQEQMTPAQPSYFPPDQRTSPREDISRSFASESRQKRQQFPSRLGETISSSRDVTCISPVAAWGRPVADRAQESLISDTARRRRCQSDSPSSESCSDDTRSR